MSSTNPFDDDDLNVGQVSHRTPTTGSTNPFDMDMGQGRQRVPSITRAAPAPVPAPTPMASARQDPGYGGRPAGGSMIGSGTKALGSTFRSFLGKSSNLTTNITNMGKGTSTSSSNVVKSNNVMKSTSVSSITPAAQPKPKTKPKMMEMKMSESRRERDQHIMVGKKRLTRWPYDNYHLTQKMYYEKKAHSPNDFLAGNREEDAPTFARPPKLPDIPSSVVGLPLNEFERKAEERAINIVSMWLIDTGLVDELMGVGNTNGANNQSGKNFDAFPKVRGSSKMDEEILKLRAETRQDLASINARLNDGVAASGSEVQELVDAVVATKADLQRLRELSNAITPQISTGEDPKQYFILTKYPHLKNAINARRNLSRCFRELDFFSHIPSTCDRLREDLHAGEWTAHEWATLRSVCREHVELEIFLVEAEAGMKKRLMDMSSTSSYMYTHNNEEVDRFLSEHVSNVWELGDEIRLRVMAGIGSAFDLAVNNPAGMVALVEAVEVYEDASEEYRRIHSRDEGSTPTQLRFTDMRAAALSELYKDMELRCMEYFNELTMQTEYPQEGEALNQQFSAVLTAANRLFRESFVVKEQMAPCFPKYWEVETLWSSVLGHFCSKQILDVIGGPEGHKLPELTVTQLLDLVAWVENFRDIIEQIFPDIGVFSSKKTYFDKPPNLLSEDKKTVNIDAAKDSLAWMNNILWDVHDAAKDEFLLNTKEQAEEWLENVYNADHTKSQTGDGRLVTSLCEDVYGLAGVQLKTIRERLTKKSEAMVQAVGVIFKNLYEKQMYSRDSFLTEFETCCAAANDFIRMTEKCEEIMDEIKSECILSPGILESLEEQSAILLNLYSSDAVYAGQKTHVYIFEPIEDAITKDLFGIEWLDDLTHNELALTLVRTLDDFMEDLERYLGELIFSKTVESLITASVLFYIKVLLGKSDLHRSSRDPYFSDCRKALTRMAGDMITIKKYFKDLAETMPALTRIVEREFEMLDTIHEMMAIAAGLSTSEARDFILVLQKRIRNIQLTKFVVGDLWHLMNPQDERNIYELVDSMEEELKVVAPTDEEAVKMANDRSSVPGLRLDQIIAKHVDQSKRKRPLKAGAIEQVETMMLGWRTTWGNANSRASEHRSGVSS